MAWLAMDSYTDLEEWKAIQVQAKKYTEDEKRISVKIVDVELQFTYREALNLCDAFLTIINDWEVLEGSYLVS